MMICCKICQLPVCVIIYSQCVTLWAFFKQVQGNVLRIPSVGLADRGLYVCTAENRAGSARQGSILEVESV